MKSAAGGTRRRLTMLPLLLVILVMASCGRSDDSENVATSPSPLKGSLSVFAASSLTDAFDDIGAAFESEYPGASVRFNFAGSQQLATQLVQGADADVFAAADQVQMQQTIDAGVVLPDPIIFARNRLAIVVPADNPAGITDPSELAQPGLKLVVAAPQVPVGQYTHEVFDRMAADPRFGATFRDRVTENIVSEESNVRQVVAKVRLGEADAGIVYVTDVSADAADDLTLIDVPDEFNVVAEYPVALVTNGDTDLAQAFIDFLLSDEGQGMLEAHGFGGTRDEG